MVEVAGNNRRGEVAKESVEVVMEERGVWRVVDVDQVERGVVAGDGGD